MQNIVFLKFKYFWSESIKLTYYNQEIKKNKKLEFLFFNKNWLLNTNRLWSKRKTNQSFKEPLQEMYYLKSSLLTYFVYFAFILKLLHRVQQNCQDRCQEETECKVLRC